MNLRRILGIFLLLAGIALVLISLYIKREVQAGKSKISSAQEQVDEGKALFGITPETKPVGEALTESAQRQIDQGRRDVTHYEKIARWCMIGGVILIVLGFFLIVIRRRKARR